MNNRRPVYPCRQPSTDELTLATFEGQSLVRMNRAEALRLAADILDLFDTSASPSDDGAAQLEQLKAFRPTTDQPTDADIADDGAARPQQDCYTPCNSTDPIEHFWTAVARGWDIEPREYFERKAVPMGFKSPIEMAVHHMWKRRVNEVLNQK